VSGLNNSRGDFMNGNIVPGVGETIRVNGLATITIQPEPLERFVFDRKPPGSVICIHVERV
jgi:uncharacterized protein